MYVVYGTQDAGAAWTAWPAPGLFPIGAMSQSWSSVDETGWTIQSDTINLSGATATITADGSELNALTEPLLDGYGSEWAISVVPQGWVAQAGTTYHVSLAGISTPIEYDVQMLDCG